MRVPLTRRGLATLLLGVALVAAGIGFRYWAVLGLGAGLTLVVLLETMAVAVASEVSATRTVEPRVVHRNGSCSGVLRLTRGSARWPVRLEAADLVGGSWLPVSLTSSEVTYQIPTRRRGLLAVGPLRLQRYGLAGMARRTDAVGEVEEVRVLPRPVRVNGLLPGRRRAAAGAEERVEHGGTDLVGLHEYVPGDDLRRLHWATSARTGTLMVRDDADPAEPHLLVLLDDRVASYPLSSDDFEDAVEMASALCTAAIASGHPVHFQTVSGRVDVDVPATLTGRPSESARELSFTFSEVDTVAHSEIARLTRRDLDVVAVVSGSTAAVDEFDLATAEAGDAVLLVVDPAPVRPVESRERLLVLRGARSDDLAAAWDLAVAR